MTEETAVVNQGEGEVEEDSAWRKKLIGGYKKIGRWFREYGGERCSDDGR